VANMESSWFLEEYQQVGTVIPHLRTFSSSQPIETVLLVVLAAVSRWGAGRTSHTGQSAVNLGGPVQQPPYTLLKTPAANAGGDTEDS